MIGENDREVVLQARHLVKDFHSTGLRRRTPHRAVADVSFTLRRGQITSLVGESGSGKSTIALMMAMLVKPSSGEVLIRGDQVRVRSDADIRRYSSTVQLILQDPYSSLNPAHTVRYILTRALLLHGNAPAKSTVDEQIGELLARVNLAPAQPYLDRYPHELSGGERQRISIARALAAKPQVLIADEPVSMLDVSIRLDILRLLARLVTDEDIAMLYITHDLATAHEFTDQMLVINKGVIVEEGPSDDVITTPKHAYTSALLAAIPNADRRQRDRSIYELPS